MPQGSILGLLLFNVFQLSIPLRRYLTITLVSDIYVEKVKKKAKKDVFSDIDALPVCFSKNGMLLNKTKCQFLLIEYSRSVGDELAQI